MGSGMNWAVIMAVYFFLLLFGVGYNLLTAYAERQGYTKGYLAFFVAGGVGITVAATAVIDLAFALVTAGAFIASGLPMIVGSMWRHMRARQEEIERLRRLVYDESQEVAA